VEQAKQAKRNGRKETALGLLRLRKFKQEQAASCEDQLLNVLTMVETIGSRQNDAAMLAARKAGKDTLQKMHEETTVDDVLNLMEAIQEEHEVEQEISSILQQVPELSADAEQAVEAELEALQAELAGPLDLAVAPTDKLPQVEAEITTTTTTQQPVRIAVPG